MDTVVEVKCPYKRQDIVHDPVDNSICRNMRSAVAKYKNVQDKKLSAKTAKTTGNKHSKSLQSKSAA